MSSVMSTNTGPPSESNLPTVKRKALRVLFVLVMFLTAFFGCALFYPLFITVFWLQLSSARWITDSIVSTWFALTVAMFELMLGIEIKVKGDVRRMNKDSCSLILMNHRTRLDWLFLFALQARHGSLRRFKISLKDELKHLPGFGWAMQAAQFLFLERKWEKDKDRIEFCLDHFERVQYAPQLLLFPEGTDFQHESIEKSREYAKKHGLEDYEYVLHPRTTGFMFFLNYMKLHNNIDQVVDVTISYPNNDMMQHETDILNFRANLPKKIVFTVQCFDIEDIPADNEPNLAQWLEKLWKEKEVYLKSIYERKHGLVDADVSSSTCQNKTLISELQVYLFSAVIFWICVAVMMTWYTIFSWYFRWYILLSFALCVLGSSLYGFDIIFPNLVTRKSH